MSTGLYWVDGTWPARLAILARPRGGDWLEDEVHSWARLGFQVILSLLTPEEAAEFDLTEEGILCRASGINFVSFPIPDRGVPSSRSDTLRLVNSLETHLVAGLTVGIHCRQGIGRSGLIAACLLVSSGVLPEVAFSRLSQARGLPVPETTEQIAWVRAFAPRVDGDKENVSNRR